MIIQKFSYLYTGAIRLIRSLCFLLVLKYLGFISAINNLSIHTYTVSFCHLLHCSLHKLAPIGCFCMVILVVQEARPRTQCPKVQCFVYITAIYLMCFLQMLILIRNKSLAVFSNLKGLFHPSIWLGVGGSLFVDSLLFSIQFPIFFCSLLQAQTCRKVKIEITWYLSFWMLQLELPQPGKEMAYKGLEFNWSKWHNVNFPKKHFIQFSC